MRAQDVNGTARRARRWPAVALAAVVVVAGAVLSQPSAAFWNEARQTETLTLTAGTAGITVVSPVAVGGARLSPGTMVQYTGGRLTNAGDTALRLTAVRADADAFAAALVVRIGVVRPGEVCTPGLEIPTGRQTTLTTWTAGMDTVLCASVALPSTATVGAGESTSVTITIAGEQ